MAPMCETITEAHLWELFKYYNRCYFGNNLIPSSGFCLKFSRITRVFGYFSFCLETHVDWNISISLRLRHHPKALRDTLIHEMIHMLAHQRYRETGDKKFLDLGPVEGASFFNRGHGAFFYSEMNRLNHNYSELNLKVVSYFGDHTYQKDKIPPVRLLVAHLDRKAEKGMIYRLHPEASLDWKLLRETIRETHGSEDIAVLQVAGACAEGFPALRRDNRARKNMKVRSLRAFKSVLARFERHPETLRLINSSNTSCRAPKNLRLAQAG